ncbi:MAG: Uma2 family endonuclease [Aphanocapsa lilacina HA4352-LM1]|nr:Uma2 family endonuclease [Aphanocapsa lilacina HA4352-LM1]
MSRPVILRWTSADLANLPDNGNRYEIIDGDLFVSRAPHSEHQYVCGRIFRFLDAWSDDSGLGRPLPGPGVIFTDADNVIPDVVWINRERLIHALDTAGQMTRAPELVVEVLSPGNEFVDREHKPNLYAQQGVEEYWIVDWRALCIEIFKPQAATLRRIATLGTADTLRSVLLPGFDCPVQRIFGR